MFTNRWPPQQDGAVSFKRWLDSRALGLETLREPPPLLFVREQPAICRRPLLPADCYRLFRALRIQETIKKRLLRERQVKRAYLFDQRIVVTLQTRTL